MAGYNVYTAENIKLVNLIAPFPRSPDGLNGYREVLKVTIVLTFIWYYEG